MHKLFIVINAELHIICLRYSISASNYSTNFTMHILLRFPLFNVNQSYKALSGIAENRALK